MKNAEIRRILLQEMRVRESARKGLDEYLSSVEALVDLYLGTDTYSPALDLLEEALDRLAGESELDSDRGLALQLRVAECFLKQERCAQALEISRDLIRRLSPKGSSRELGRSYYFQGRALAWMGRYEQAKQSCSRASVILHECGDLRYVGWCHLTLGLVLYRTGGFADAQEHLEAAHYLFKWEIKDRDGLAEVLSALGLCSKQRCELAKAAKYFEDAHELSIERGNSRSTAIILQNMAIVAFKLGNWDRAEASFKEALKVNRRIGRRVGIIRATIGYANLLRGRGRWGEAEEMYLNAAELSRTGKFRREEVLAQEFLGEMRFEQRKPKEALRLYDQALRLAKEFAPEGDLITELCRRRAEAYLALGDIQRARAEVETGLRVARKIGDSYELGALYRVEGLIFKRIGDRQKCIRKLKDSVEHFDAANEKPELTKSVLALGLALRETGADSERQAGSRFLLKAQLLSEEMDSPALYDRTSGLLGLLGVGSAGVVEAGGSPSLSGGELMSDLPFEIVADDPAMLDVVRRAAQLSTNGVRVLIQGETGVGKNLLASIFRFACEKAGKPFVELDCATLPPELVESELFGHVRGAFSGAVRDKSGILEQADGGTVFLNEIGELTPRLQTKLLTVLDDGVYRRVGDCKLSRIRVRVVAATNRDLAAEVEKGTFRRDLYYRLTQVLLRVPPLRQRPRDVRALTHFFLAAMAEREQKRVTASEPFLRALESYSWPGNVRELKNLLESIVLGVPDGSTLDTGQLLQHSDMGDAAGVSSAAGTLSDRVEAFKKREVLRVLKECDGNRTLAASMLGLSRAGLLKMLKRFGTSLD